MQVVLGVKYVSDSIDFETKQSVDEVREAIANTSENSMIELTDINNRKIIMPKESLSYAIIGDKPKHTVGFGALN